MCFLFHDLFNNYVMEKILSFENQNMNQKSFKTKH